MHSASSWFLVTVQRKILKMDSMFVSRHIAVVVSGALHLVAHLQGSYVYDINGKKYIDALAGLWCTALGMCKLWCQI